MRVGPAPALLLFLALTWGTRSFAAETAEHWLIGGWEEQNTGAVLKVSGVRPDGSALGTMGGSVDAQGKAEIKVDGSRVRISTALGSVIEVVRKPDGTLAGTRMRPDGSTRPLILTRMQLCTDPVPASGQAYGPPKYCVGDAWTFTGGRVQRVVSVDADSVVMIGYPMLGGPCPGCLFELGKDLTLRSIRQPDGNSPDATRGFLPVGEQWRYWDFPLTDGKSWRISASAFLWNSPSRYTIDCSVQGYEDVKTQAGTFKAFKVYRKWHFHQGGLGGPDWSDLMWFAPAVKTIVKLEQTTASIGIYWELASYDLKDFAATYVRRWQSEQALRAKGLAPLTQQQLEERYARRVEARYESSLGARGTLSVMPDGSVRISGTLEDTGTWRIKDGMFCTKWAKIRQSAEGCLTQYRTGDWEISYFQVGSPVIGVFIDVD